MKRRAPAFMVIVMLLLWGGAARAAPRALTVDLAARSVDITTGFDGAELILFGVRQQPGDIALVIHGPGHTMVVRHRQPVMGIWMNRESATFANVPVYYDFALSRPEAALAPQDVRTENGIGLDGLRFIYLGRDDPGTEARFREALVRNKQAQGHFPLEPKRITFLGDNFFRARFYLPSDVPTGLYRIDAYLIRDGIVLDRRALTLRVAQVGTSAYLQRMAYRHGFWYGLAAIAMALAAGWAAHAFLRRD